VKLGAEVGGVLTGVTICQEYTRVQFPPAPLALLALAMRVSSIERVGGSAPACPFSFRRR
jgi:hypothetical protein